MTDTTKPAGARPSHRLFSVSGEGTAANWTEIGAAWPNRDGDGFLIRCNAIPLDGRTIMRRAERKPVTPQA